MQVGATIKTRIGGTPSSSGYYPVLTRDGSKLTVIGKVQENVVVGTFVRLETVGLVEFCVYKNTNPIVSGGQTYVYGVIQSLYISQSGTQASYYCLATQLNIRSAPTSASTTNIIGKANKSQLVGTGDGTEKNGFLQLVLTNGKTGWASKAYLTTKNPVTGSKPVPTAQDPDLLPDPADDPQLIQTTVANTVGDQWTPYVKWGAIALIAVIVLVTIVRATTKKGAKKS